MGSVINKSSHLKFYINKNKMFMYDTVCFTQSASKHLVLSFKENTSMFWLRCSRDSRESKPCGFSFSWPLK